MRKRQTRAALYTGIAGLGVFIPVTLVVGYLSFSDALDRYQAVEHFVGTDWIRRAPDKWSIVRQRLDELYETAIGDGRSRQVPLVHVDEFTIEATKHTSESARRYSTNVISETDKRNYEMNFAFGVMTHPNNETPDLQDRSVFQTVVSSAAARYSHWLKAGEPKTPFTRNLASALGLVPRGRTGPLGINNVYIGSETGTAAFFPANAELAVGRDEGTAYDARSRPWFQSALHGEKTEADGGGPDPQAGLTYEYPDYSERVNYVRTAWRRFRYNDRQYVIGIDMILYGDEPNIGTNAMVSLVNDLSGFSEASALNAVRTGAIFASPLWLLSLALLLGAFPTLRNRLALGERTSGQLSYRFDRSGPPMYWRAAGHGDEIRTFVRDEQFKIGASVSQTSELKLGFQHLLLGLKKTLWGERETKLGQVTRITQQNVRGPADPTERCVEHWRLTEIRDIVRRCRSCRQAVRVGATNRTVAELTAIYRDYPTVDIQPAWVERVDETVLDKRHATSFLADRLESGGFPDTPISLITTSRPAPKLELPTRVRRLPDVAANIKLDRQIAEGRVGYSSGISIGFQEYGDGCVRAVCDTWFMKWLLEIDKEGMLLTGSDIMRLLFCRDEDELRHLYDLHGKKFQAIVERAGKQLWYVLKSDLPDYLETFNRWDFSVLDYDTREQLVIVTEPGRSETNYASGGEGPTGEISWRKADVEFYHEVYCLMYTHKRNLKDLLYRWSSAPSRASEGKERPVRTSSVVGPSGKSESA